MPRSAAHTSTVPAEGAEPVRPSAMRRLWRNPLAVAAFAWVALVVVVAVFAPLIAPDDPIASNYSDVLAGPSWAHWLGTDSLGRDVMSRLMYGAGPTLTAVAIAAVVAVAVGVVTGLLAGFTPGWVDNLITRVADVLLSMPMLIIVLVVLAVFSNNLLISMVVLGLLLAPRLLRVVRSATIAVRHELYVDAARVSGLSDGRIMFRHILPRVVGPVVVQASLIAASALITVTGLSYLGLGEQPPAPSWGGMVAEAGTVISQQPWLLVPAGATIGLTVLAFSLLGDAVRDASVESWSAVNRASRSAPRHAARRPAVAAAASVERGAALLQLTGVSVSRDSDDRAITSGVGFELSEGEVLGVVGESGSGKSMTAMAILGLLPPGTSLTSGTIRYRDTELTALPPRDLSRLRGTEIGLVSQEPLVSLDPSFTVGSQLGELVRKHRKISRPAARRAVLDLLADVRLPDPRSLARRYPHELSGGMAQRVVIAMALAGNPSVLIADEPTTALDVTVQAEILDLLRSLREERGLAILLVTHNFGVVADLCDRVVVMRAGEVVEQADVQEIFRDPRAEYTRTLLAANLDDCVPRPRLATAPAASGSETTR